MLEIHLEKFLFLSGQIFISYFVIKFCSILGEGTSVDKSTADCSWFKVNISDWP